MRDGGMVHYSADVVSSPAEMKTSDICRQGHAEACPFACNRGILATQTAGQEKEHVPVPRPEVWQSMGPVPIGSSLG